MTVVAETLPSKNFEPTFAAKVNLISPGVTHFGELVQQQTGVEILDPYSQASISAYTELLNGPGKRIRGVLAATAYELACALNGGATSYKQNLIADTAGIIEGVQAMLLGIDDMADNDDVRRGMPTMHFAVRRAMKGKEKGNLTKRAYDYAVLNLFVVNNVLPKAFSQLDISSKRKVKMGTLMGDSLIRTARGQGWDMKPLERKERVSVDEMLQIAQDKTGDYTVETPLAMGAELGQMPPGQREFLLQYAEKVGQAFQVRDDILGTFGDPAITGKSNSGDFREGKRTMLVALAHERASNRDLKKLDRALGRTALTAWGKKRKFASYKKVLQRSGAVDAASEMVSGLTQEAINTLPGHWPEAPAEFLRDLALYNAHRKK